LTVPVVFVWAAVWALFDNYKVVPVWSAVACIGVVFLCAVCDIDERLRCAFEGLPTLAHHIGDIVFTSFLVLLVVGSWIGVWETVDHKFELAEHPHFAAAAAMFGAVGLTAMQRHRSAIFPPIDFSVDDGDHFAKVGHTDPESLAADSRPLVASPQAGKSEEQ